jgi:hypothetical protein
MGKGAVRSRSAVSRRRSDVPLNQIVRAGAQIAPGDMIVEVALAEQFLNGEAGRQFA